MESSFMGSAKLRELSGGTGMIDMRFCYSPKTAYTMLTNMGAPGRAFYAKLLCLDFVFSVFFMFANSTLITLLLRHIKADSRFLLLNILPVLRSIFDIFENCFLFIMIFLYPRKLTAISIISTIFTSVKWSIYGIALAVTLALTAILIYKKSVKKIDAQYPV
ncbi:MAG: hypothetical protein Q8865_02165 [Bacillota bacterium]|nr:hypothetical protein [Bacillota bacterium]